MKPALGYRLIQAISFWHDLPNGEAIKAMEQEVITERLSMCFGNHLLKVGCLATAINTDKSLINHQINVANNVAIESKVGVVGEIDDLPFQSQSIDAALLNHVLEFSADPHQTLREVHRVLIPNGNLVLTLFNPLSFLLLGKIWPFKSKKSFWRCRLFTIARIKDWLHLLGFEVTDVKYLCYSSLLGAKKGEVENRFVRKFSKLVPKLGSICIITVKKREWPLTPIRPRVRYRTVFQPAVRTASMVDHQKK